MKKIAIFSALIFFSFAWLRTLGIFLFKLAPAQQMQYITSNNWDYDGFPHTRGPFIVDGDHIWQLSQYNQPLIGVLAKKSEMGMVRFDMKRGIAQMQWKLGKPYITIEGALKKKNGDIIILWRDKNRTTKLSTLLCKGGIQHYRQLPNNKNFTYYGMALINGMLQIAGQNRKQKSTIIYSYNKNSQWTKKHLSWPRAIPKRATTALAFHKNGAWYALLIHWSKYAKSSKENNIGQAYLLTEENTTTKRNKNMKVTPLGKTTAPRYSLWNWIDKTPGNLFNTRVEKNTLYQLEGKNLIKFSPGPIAKKNSILRLNFLYNTFTISPNNLKQIHRWTTATYRKTIFSYNNQETQLKHMPATDARNVRLAVHLNNKNQQGPALVESFRFSISCTLTPATDNGYWLLGTFGKYIKINNRLERVNTPGFFSRLARTIATYGSREAQYNDFYLEAAFLKKLVMPFFLFGLPLIWLLFPGIAYLKKNRKEKQGWKHFFKQHLFPGALVYSVLFIAGFYWFWKISMNF